MDAVTQFYTYVNTQVFTLNIRAIDAIRNYLLDNTVPVNYKRINAIRDAIIIIQNHCNTQIIINNTNINNNIDNNINDNINYNMNHELYNTLNMITDTTNILNNILNNNNI
jgi:hypothetical protein